LKKRILFDQQIFRLQRFGGISRYFTGLITGINAQPDYEALPHKFYADNVYLAKKGLVSFTGFLKPASFKYKPIFEKLLLKFENYKLRTILKKGNFDVFHPTYYDPGFLKYLPEQKPLVITVHDMIHENYHDNLYEYLSGESKNKLVLIPRADHIIAVSNYTKAQIIKHYPDIDPGKISVIYHGSNLNPGPTDTKPNVLPDNYLLFVGVKKHYKNFFWLAEALKDYLKENNITLLCAGSADFDVFEQKFLSRLELNSYVGYMPVNTDEDLAMLYKNAVCFIFPSLEEGFGMPVLEAFACGCPALLSNSGSLPEVGGDAALYFDPGDKEQLIKQIELISKDEQTKRLLINKGNERVKLFSWANTVAEHIKVYHSLLT
jgi:glycosyltransferase involved in cell wall biosynthesis